MNYGVIVLALLLTSAAPAWAQQDGSATRQTAQVQQRLEEIKERLALTPEQIEQIRPVLEDELRELQALRDRSNGPEQGRRARRRMARELREIQRSADERLSKILTKQQMDEMKKIREERRAELRARAGR